MAAIAIMQAILQAPGEILESPIIFSVSFIFKATEKQIFINFTSQNLIKTVSSKTTTMLRSTFLPTPTPCPVPEILECPLVLLCTCCRVLHQKGKNVS